MSLTNDMLEAMRIFVASLELNVSTAGGCCTIGKPIFYTSVLGEYNIFFDPLDFLQ